MVSAPAEAALPLLASALIPFGFELSFVEVLVTRGDAIKIITLVRNL